jgi:hypothetical protein
VAHSNCILAALCLQFGGASSRNCFSYSLERRKCAHLPSQVFCRHRRNRSKIYSWCFSCRLALQLLRNSTPPPHRSRHIHHSSRPLWLPPILLFPVHNPYFCDMAIFSTAIQSPRSSLQYTTDTIFACQALPHSPVPHHLLWGSFQHQHSLSLLAVAQLSHVSAILLHALS